MAGHITRAQQCLQTEFFTELQESESSIGNFQSRLHACERVVLNGHPVHRAVSTRDMPRGASVDASMSSARQLPTSFEDALEETALRRSELASRNWNPCCNATSAPWKVQNANAAAEAPWLPRAERVRTARSLQPHQQQQPEHISPKSSSRERARSCF